MIVMCMLSEYPIHMKAPSSKQQKPEKRDHEYLWLFLYWVTEA